jgi:glycosyltransferase involved in cell wall biosynthesis
LFSLPAEKYVCAFRGRRDSYQAPLALAEGELLDRFITDAYLRSWLRTVISPIPEAFREKIESRYEAGIPAELVRCLWGTTALEHFRHRIGMSPASTFNKLDQHFSLAASRRAKETRAHLFMYSPYAWEAFTMRYTHTPRKVLFQYHPHADLEGRYLAADSAHFPTFGNSLQVAQSRRNPNLVRREGEAWKHADLVLCASTFTMRSLLEAGAEPQRCRVIPYGIEVPALEEGDRSRDAFHAIFVGSDGHRKGLHHLLLSWQRAALAPSSRLTLVCRVIDREMERLAAATQGVELLREVPLQKLNALYSRSSLFVMPSLAEGFGQVYLEALAQGCPVLGTPNTCLPDLGGEANGVFLTKPGDLNQLTSRLEQLSKVLPGSSEIRRAARACASRFTWPAFRDNLRSALQSFPASDDPYGEPRARIISRVA